MNLENMIGIYLGIKLVNGRFKPNFNKGAIIGLTFFGLILLFSIFFLVYSIIELNFSNIFISLFGIFSIMYILLISPYTQNSKNYYIEFKDENTLSGFNLYYKGKLVTVQYIVGNDGRIAFKNNKDKLSCISYDDNSKMSNFTKYRIINYFTKWLSENNLISSDVTVTFEK